AMKSAHRVDQHIEDQILAGYDVDFMRPTRIGDAFRQFAGSVEVSHGQRQELVAVRRQRVARPRTAALAVELPTHASFQDHQPIPHALFGNMQGAGGLPQAAATRQLDKRGDMFGGEGDEQEACSQNKYNENRYSYSIKQFI